MKASARSQNRFFLAIGALSDRQVRDPRNQMFVQFHGYLYANEAPGWGVEIDEKAAAKYPFGAGREGGERGKLNGGWGEVRKRDGSIIKQ